MSGGAHFPEPWRFEDGTIIAANGQAIIGGYEWEWGQEGEYPNPGPDVRRIVACVNACAGIPTEALEAGALAKALEGLAGLIYCVDCWDNPQHNACPKHLDPARDALRALGRLP